jgi:carboxypeptidase family protein
MIARHALAVACLPLLLFSCRTNPQIAVPPTHGHRLVGYVVDTRSHKRLTEAVVQLGKSARTARVDSIGAFSFANVPDGQLTLRTRRIGYYPGEGTIVVQSNDSGLVEIGLDPLVFCLDYCDARATPGYVKVIR